MSTDQSQADRRVGFIGLGDIGKPMAKRLIEWPGGLTVFDIAPEPLQELGDLGAKVAGSVAELAAECAVISIMVRTEDQVRDVMGEILGAAKPGTTIAVHSTVSPDLPARLEDVASRHDMLVVDAPVSGGAMGADHPVMWSRSYEGGRAWYTAGGHTIESFAEPLYLDHLGKAIVWAAGR